MAATTMEARQAEKMLNRQQAADFLGLKKQTLDSWATTKRHGLKFYKVGGSVRYKISDLLAWLESRAQGGVAVPSH